MFFRKKGNSEIREEQEIIRQAKKQPEAFGVLYEKYYRAVFVFTDRRLQDRETAADLTAQVFYKALVNLPKYKDLGLPFSAWLFRIAANQINEFYRKSAQSRVVSLDSSAVENLPFLGPDRDTADLLAKLLEQLDEAEVFLIELRFFEDRPFKEIAYILDITENNAKTRTYRILDKLKKLAEEERDI